jgi:hypothetical protein
MDNAMLDREFSNLFETIFGKAITATLIPYLTHDTLSSLTRFGSDPNHSAKVPVGDRPKQPSDQASQTPTDNRPTPQFPSSNNIQHPVDSKRISRDSGRVKASTEGEGREGEGNEGSGGGSGGHSEYFGENICERENESEGYIEGGRETIYESELAINESELAELEKQANEAAIQWLEQQGVNIQEAMQIAKVNTVQEFVRLPINEVTRTIERVLENKGQQERENQKQQREKLKERLEQVFGSGKKLSEISLQMAGLALEGLLKSSVFVADKTFQLTINTANQFLEALFKSGNTIGFEHFYSASKGNIKEALRNYQNYVINQKTIEKISNKYKITKEQIAQLSKKSLSELYLNKHSKTLKEVSKIVARETRTSQLKERQRIKEETLKREYKEFQEKIRILRERVLLDKNQNALRIDNLIQQVKAINPLLGENHTGIESKIINTWNQYESHYEGLTDKINSLLESTGSRNLNSSSVQKELAQINQLIQKRGNLVRAMEREIPTILTKARNQIREQNIKEKKSQFNKEGQKLDKAARERERQIVEEKYLQLKASIEIKQDIHSEKIQEIGRQYLEFISLIQKSGFTNFANVENNLQKQWNQYSEKYSQFGESINRLQQQFETSKVIHNETSINKIATEINRLLEQQSNLINRMQKETPANIDKAARAIQEQFVEEQYQFIGQFAGVIRRIGTSKAYKAIKEAGEAAEPFVAQEIFKKEFGLEIINVGKLPGGRGFDGVFRDAQGNLIINESKVNFSSNPKRSFASALGEGYGHKQASPGWIKAVAEQMVQVGSVQDKQIGAEILSNLDKVKVVGTFLDARTNTIQVLSAINNGQWKATDVFLVDPSSE